MWEWIPMTKSASSAGTGTKKSSRDQLPQRRGRSLPDRRCGHKTDSQETDPWSRSGNAGRHPREKETDKKTSYPGR